MFLAIKHNFSPLYPPPSLATTKGRHVDYYWKEIRKFKELVIWWIKFKKNCLKLLNEVLLKTRLLIKVTKDCGDGDFRQKPLEIHFLLDSHFHAFVLLYLFVCFVAGTSTASGLQSSLDSSLCFLLIQVISILAWKENVPQHLKMICCLPVVAEKRPCLLGVAFRATRLPSGLSSLCRLIQPPTFFDHPLATHYPTQVLACLTFSLLLLVSDW